MPVSKKRKKDGKSRRRDRGDAPIAPPAPQPEAPQGGGLLSRMRGGLRNMAGTGPKKESLASKVVTWAILLVALYFVARRFGILP